MSSFWASDGTTCRIYVRVFVTRTLCYTSNIFSFKWNCVKWNIPIETTIQITTYTLEPIWRAPGPVLEEWLRYELFLEFCAWSHLPRYSWHHSTLAPPWVAGFSWLILFDVCTILRLAFNGNELCNICWYLTISKYLLSTFMGLWK